MDPGGEGLDVCVRRLVEIFEGSRSLLEESQWFPSNPGSTRWWGGLETPLEVILTAILVKLSRWKAALAALESMRRKRLLSTSRLAEADPEEVAVTIRGVGFARSKARTIVAVSRYIESLGGVEALINRDAHTIRKDLLKIDGIGKETADSILLFALNKSVFPIARLSARVLSRYCGIRVTGYEYMRERIENMLEKDLYKLKLLHAGLTTIASRYCRRNKPLCGSCILRHECTHYSQILRTVDRI